MTQSMDANFFFSESRTTHPPLICLMGPTAAGKTPLAMAIVKRFPCQIISVDSAMVYRGMDIGTAKPSAAELLQAPHRLIDIADPSEVYSAGQFRQDVLREIDQVIAEGCVPLLVGGSMMYFRILQQGIAKLPAADKQVRANLQERAIQEGWEALHAELVNVDPDTARHIHVRDSQRIQRALEVYLLSGKPMSVWRIEETVPLSGYDVHHWIIAPSTRECLHKRIEKRFYEMIEKGFVAEVERLYARKDLTPDLPSVRSVGYRQVWEYLAGSLPYQELPAKVIAATRQLAKRQLTWLRPWPQALWFDSEEAQVFDKIACQLDKLFRSLTL